MLLDYRVEKADLGLRRDEGQHVGQVADNVVASIVGSNSPSLQRAAQPVHIVLVSPYSLEYVRREGHRQAPAVDPLFTARSLDPAASGFSRFLVA